MKIRFNVNQAEALRRGVDCPTSVYSITIDPVKLTQAQRDLLADRLDGIDLCQLTVYANGHTEPGYDQEGNGDNATPRRIKAALPTLESLWEAVEADARLVHEKLAELGQQKTLAHA